MGVASIWGIPRILATSLPRIIMTISFAFGSHPIVLRLKFIVMASGSEIHFFVIPRCLITNKTIPTAKNIMRTKTAGLVKLLN